MMAEREAGAGREFFEESLRLQPLANGALLSFANFSVAIDGRDWRHLDLFPRSVVELVLASDAREFHLSLSSGRWLDDEWGGAPEPAPAGLNLWAWLPDAGAADGWRALTRGLGSLLCAAIGRLGGPTAEGGRGRRTWSGSCGPCGRSRQRRRSLRWARAMAVAPW